MYEWKAGYRSANGGLSRKSDEEISYDDNRAFHYFSIYFQAKPTVRFVALLPWIAIGLALLGILNNAQ
jgi:hypothetical protein